MTAKRVGEGRLGVEGLSEKDKGLMDMDNCVVTAGEGGHRGLNGNGKNTRKMKQKLITFLK